MRNEESDTTSVSVPKGKYTTRKQVESDEMEPVGTLGDATSLDRQLRIEATEKTPSTYKFVIDVTQEEERRLFNVLNRRLKKLKY